MSLKNLIFCICIEHPKSIIMRIGVVGKQKKLVLTFLHI